MKFASESQPRLPSLEAFKWRVDVGISTRSTTVCLTHTLLILLLLLLLLVLLLPSRVTQVSLGYSKNEPLDSLGWFLQAGTESKTGQKRFCEVQ